VTDESVSAAVDVAKLMEEIKERVRERRASGFYSEDEVRRIAQMELEVTQSVPGFQTEIEDHLAALNDAWDTAAEPVLSSHRKRLGLLIVGLKRFLRRATKPYIQVILARQVEFNSKLLHLLNAFVLPVRDGIGGVQRTAEELALGLNEGARRHREVSQRLDALGRELVALRAALDQARTPAGPVALPVQPAPPPGGGTLPEGAYLAFEDRHRGLPEDIRQRQRGYLDLFRGGPILDVGCGRGEFLELCREAGLPARGIDLDPGMVRRCREAGLAVEQSDALGYLAGLPEGELGGIFCSHLIEHLPPDVFIGLVRLAHAKLRPGGVLVCETPNPACLAVFSGAFYVDLTHLKPIHPEAAVFVLEAAGFRDVALRLLNPCPPETRLRLLEPLWYMRRYEEAFIQAINDNFTRLNDLLWAAQDYAVIGYKP
jgi:O-antigen chain-terminating methyltransferase